MRKVVPEDSTLCLDNGLYKVCYLPENKPFFCATAHCVACVQSSLIAVLLIIFGIRTSGGGGDCVKPQAGAQVLFQNSRPSPWIQ